MSATHSETLPTVDEVEHNLEEMSSDRTETLSGDEDGEEEDDNEFKYPKTRPSQHGDGSYSRPSGRNPSGYSDWDSKRGCWKKDTPVLQPKPVSQSQKQEAPPRNSTEERPAKRLRRQTSTKAAKTTALDEPGDNLGSSFRMKIQGHGLCKSDFEMKRLVDNKRSSLQQLRITVSVGKFFDINQVKAEFSEGGNLTVTAPRIAKEEESDSTIAIDGPEE